MKNLGISLLFLAVIAGTGFSQTQSVAITGHVKDPNGKPLTNTLVRMGVGMLYTTTDSNGYYALGGPVNTIQPVRTDNGNSFPQPTFVAGKVLFSLPQSSLVRISMFDIAGRFVKDVINGRMGKGNYSVTVNSRNISYQPYLVRLTIDGNSTVLKIASMSCTAAGPAGASGPKARLEKLAAFIDTLHATEPGYSLGIQTIQSPTGTYDFQLTKVSTWNGDTAAFWGDTSALSAAAKSAGHFIFALINRTNGMYPDSMIYWANGDGGTPVRMSDQPLITNPGNGRLYIMVGYNAKTSVPYRPMNKVWDFEEHNTGATSYNGNLTRVDYYGTPLAMRLHSTDGTADLIRGEIYPVFFQPRQTFFDEFVNEVPWQWTKCATLSAPYKILNPCMVPDFQTGGSQAHYWDEYAAACHVTAGSCVSINDPKISSGLYRHTLDLTDAQQVDYKYFFKKAPCTFYGYFLHRRAFFNKQYTFPYDDYGQIWSSFIASGKAQWLLIAVGY
jgi:hypothetical protein